VRALVAGGAGFIGSHLCRALLDAGHEVTCVDNLSTGRFGNVADLEGRDGFQWVPGDITGHRTRYGPNPDVIIHLASPASPVDYQRMPIETLNANSLGTHRLLSMARTSRARFIFASTSEVYGDPLVHPQPEEYWGNVDPVGPRSMYDEGKRFGEALVTAYRERFGVPAAIVRIFNTYGPGMRLDDGRVIPAFLAAAMDGLPLPVQGDGLQTRSYMFVEDLVRGLMAVAEDPDLDGQVLNIGNPEEVTVLELARRVLEATGFEPTLGMITVPARPGDPRQRCPDISRMVRRYGWSPAWTLTEGLRRTWEAYR
jgi:dTDP-glucose 4,6-dehydratase